jgi:hypothetical protein
MDEFLILLFNFYGFFFPIILINYNFMKHNLIIYDITFVE